jgi:tetratricopeptide (TPR) repeat protein
MRLTPWLLLVIALDLSAADDDRVRAWQDSLQLPTYRAGEASPTPQFAIFNSDVANYPYPLFNNLTKDKRERAWRTLNLENEYLLCRILPDLGGHLYSCRDKRNGREMFYANPVIKPANVGLRGAWAALGIESNFPIGHSRVSISPVDSAIREEPDGSGRAIVQDIDRVTGMQWRVEYVLRPGSTVLEQRVTLCNRSAVRWPYYWWSDAAVAFDDPATRMILPTYLVSTHTTPAEIVRWPVTVNGKDGSIVANHKDAAAWFAYGSREPFFAIYKPGSRSGLAHYADPGVMSGKKLWLWGSEQDAWVKRELTDNFPSYVEMQSGRFQNQNIFQPLDPEQSARFSEFWIPVYDVGGVTRVTRDVILNLRREPALRIELSATHAIRNADLQVVNGSKRVFETRVNLDPRATYSKILENPGDAPYTIQLVDNAGVILVRHTEGSYDAAGPDRIKLGTIPRPCPDGHPQTEAALLACGDSYESAQQWPLALADYSAGRKKFPANAELARAGGRLALNLNRFEEAVSLFSPLIATDATDAVSMYGLGLAQAMLGDDAQARLTLSRVSPSGALGSAAAVQLALLSARAKDDAGALAILKPLAVQHSGSPKIAGFVVALLRRSGHRQEALQQLNPLYAADPADNMLRFERVLLEDKDEDLWKHLAVDGERVLDLVDVYLSLGSAEDALRLLSHAWPQVAPAEVEPGAIPAAIDPLLAYYRAFVRARLGRDATQDLRTAASGFTRYVFPHRWSSLAVLNSALKANPSDAHARLLLGRLYLDQLKTDEAIAQWQEARKLDPALPELDRDLGSVLIEVRKDPAGMLMLKEGIERNPEDRELRELLARVGADQLSIPQAVPAPPRPDTQPSRPAAQPRLPDAPPPRSSSPVDVASAAMLRAAAGRADEAETMFDPKVFSSDRQPDQVRQAWIEVQLQKLLSMARAGRCPEAMSGLLQLGNENTGLGFTLYGFGRFMKLAHFQFYTAAIEFDCHDEKSARKLWARVSRMPETLPSPEFVFPILAAARLDLNSERPAIAAALQAVRAELTKADPASKPLLIYEEGMLLRASGKDEEAVSQFRQAVSSGDSMIQYLALTEMNQTFFAK